MILSYHDSRKRWSDSQVSLVQVWLRNVRERDSIWRHTCICSRGLTGTGAMYADVPDDLGVTCNPSFVARIQRNDLISRAQGNSCLSWRLFLVWGGFWWRYSLWERLTSSVFVSICSALYMFWVWKFCQPYGGGSFPMTSIWLWRRLVTA